MRIGEAAQEAGVATRMLRYYEHQNLVVPGRDSNNYRHYCDEGVTRARQVRALLDAGLPTRLIALVLNESDPDHVSSRVDLEEVLVQYADALGGRAMELLERRRALLAFIERLGQVESSMFEEEAGRVPA